jgi:Iron only hydrogenase large subunit, C-terminal domain/Putative Fe-S cluster
LHAAGFDAVWDYGVEVELETRAIVAYLEGWRGARPLVNMTCPVIVRLIQVSYPRMTEQLIQMQPPREVAGRAVKEWYAAELGLPQEQIGAIYVTPCQARTISILQPAEGGKSYLDGAIGIPQVYNTILSTARETAKAGSEEEGVDWEPVRSAGHLGWATPNRLESRLRGYGYMSVTGLTNVTDVFDDLERGRLKGIDFLECYACWAGCANGNLTVDNVYVSQAKLQSLMARLPESDPQTAAEVRRRWAHEDFSLERPFVPRAAAHVGDLRERVRRVKDAERVLEILPGVDCGLCGAPTCAVLARDVAGGTATVWECVFVSDARLQELRRLHGTKADHV